LITGPSSEMEKVTETGATGLACVLLLAHAHPFFLEM
jgi:hypothetical protein